jgi:hypothetical protein
MVRSSNIGVISVVVGRIEPKRIARLLVMVCDEPWSAWLVAIYFIDTRCQYMIEARHDWSAEASPSPPMG